MKTVDLILRLVAAIILLQTLYFKFLGAEESVFIFSKLGVEPWGRYASGIVELAAAILLLIPKTAWKGAILALCAMSGALLSHVFVLGIQVQGDGGLLFALGIAVFVSSAVSLFIHRQEISFPGTNA
ncbi:MAG: DoxX family protein [Verrucomicrobia bacterium]|nr:DoxX family protein [Verrucomicrobiota bacterium]